VFSVQRLGLGLGLKFGFELVLAFLKDLCDINEHQKIAYSMGDKLQIPAGNQKTY